MTPLDLLVREEIRASGPMSLARLMDLALQHPDYGYYRTRDPLGTKGDFITAPEISQMFGEMIGLWVAELWRAMGAPPAFALVEMGPGRGTLLQDALRATRKISGFHAALKLHLLESSPVFREAQAEKLGAFAPVYVDDLDEVPPLPLIVLANEFFDALPIRQFMKRPEGWRERKVALENENGKQALGRLDPRLVFVDTEPEAPFREPPTSHVWEESLSSELLMHKLSGLIARRGGGALIVDYGYAVPPDQMTFQAVACHAFADPLLNLGEADLTAHVNFQSLGRLASDAGLRVLGPLGQGAFLENLGIGLRTAQVKLHATDPQALDQDLHRLTDSGEMGILFKALGVVSREIQEVAGFS